MKLAYADPPYIGQAHRYAEKTEVDHSELIARLRGYDGWALSCSSPTLGYLLSMAPEARIGAWVKPFCSFKPNVNPAYAWEPVLFVSSRKRARTEPTVRDWVSVNITLKKGLCGAKPPAFCSWILDIIGWQPGDVVDDMFPGTNSMAAAIESRAK